MVIWIALIVVGAIWYGSLNVSKAAVPPPFIPASCGGPDTAACTALHGVDSAMATADAAGLLELETPVSVKCPDAAYATACYGGGQMAVQLFGIDENGMHYLDRNAGVAYLRRYMAAAGPFKPAGVAWAAGGMAASYAGPTKADSVRLVMHETSGGWQLTHMSLKP